MKNIQEPTAEQCSNQEKVYEDEQKAGYALWYPQMGGYVGKAVALFDKQWTEGRQGSREGGCIDVLIWHNGEFPFSGEGGNEQQPVHLHHCDAEQFIRFGEALTRLNKLGLIKK